MRGSILLLGLVMAGIPGVALAADAVPLAVGDCVRTTIAELGNRVADDPNGGYSIRYGNDVTGMSLYPVPELEGTKVDDRVRLCLTGVPTNCPPGEEKGRYYAATNLRTGKTWEMPDTDRLCEDRPATL